MDIKNLVRIKDDSLTFTKEHLLKNPPKWVKDKELWEKIVNSMKGEESTMESALKEYSSRLKGTVMSEKVTDSSERFIKSLKRISDSYNQRRYSGNTAIITYKGKKVGFVRRVKDSIVVQSTTDNKLITKELEKLNIGQSKLYDSLPFVKSILLRVNDASSAQLKDKIKALGLDPSGKSVPEMEMVLAMAYWAQDHPGEEFPDQFSPMLAKDTTRAEPEWIDENFKDTDWMLQEKFDGMRSILSLDGSKVRMTSRSKSVKDFQFTPHQDNILGFLNIKNPFKGKTVLDGELMSPTNKIDTGATVTKTSLQAIVALVHMNKEDSLALQRKIGSPIYHAFDCLYFDGENVQDLTYEERDNLCATAVKMLQDANPGIPLIAVPTIKEFKSAYEVFQTFIKEGKEGVMLKKKSGKYKQGNRSSELQKLKGYVDVDAFVTGFVPSSEDKGFKDLIGGLTFSCYVDGKETEIANVSNIPMEIRKQATLLKDGKPTLAPEFKNRCAALIGQQIMKGGKLGSARINEWRPDKDPEDCKITKEEYEEMMSDR